MNTKNPDAWTCDDCKSNYETEAKALDCCDVSATDFYPIEQLSTTKHIPQIRLASLVQWWIEDIEGAIDDIKNGKLPEIQPLMSVKSAIESCAPRLVKQAAECDRLKESNSALERNNAKLLEACQAAVEGLRNHPQYDSPEDLPSLEAIGLEACQAAIAKADPALERG